MKAEKKTEINEKWRKFCGSFECCTEGCPLVNTSYCRSFGNSTDYQLKRVEKIIADYKASNYLEEKHLQDGEA